MKNILAACILFILPVYLVAQGPVVDTRDGKVEGYQTAGGIRVFKGIPFAAPPVGPLRWKVPQPATPWEGVKECTEFGPSPVQAKPSPFMFWSSEFLIPESPISENCLYLNVWTPGIQTTDKKAVLVYIYGGGFQSGGAACPIYDGSAMAKKDLVFVTFNYRVGRFGFLAHPGLSRESPENTSGNFALLDMIAALKWVRDNIAAFGGDPDNVTIAGQSAGAFAVNYLTVSPLAHDLFQKAIAQSGGNFYSRQGRNVPSLEEAESQGVELGNELGASGVEELRKLPADKILGAKAGTTWPVVDGYVIPESVYEAYRLEKQADVPLIVGWNADDRVFINPAEDFEAALKERFGEKAGPFLEVYPHTDAETARQSILKMGRDETFAVQGFTWAEQQFKKRGRDVYVYNFNRKLPAHDPETAFGAFHSSEIVYAYNNLHTLNRPWEDADRHLARVMSDYWANFARTGNPNAEGLPLWKAFDPGSQNTIILDDEIENMKLPDTRQLQVWQDYHENR